MGAAGLIGGLETTRQGGLRGPFRACCCARGARSNYFLPSGASMRLHPKSRASTDHRPGPNIARAAAMVPVNRATTGCSSILRICEIANAATIAPATGVHRPTTRRSAARPSEAELSATRNDGSCHSLRPVSTRRTAPTTPRISSKPMPGQLPANVEYSRRNTHLTDYWVVAAWSETPCRAADVAL